MFIFYVQSFLLYHFGLLPLKSLDTNHSRSCSREAQRETDREEHY